MMMWRRFPGSSIRKEEEGEVVSLVVVILIPINTCGLRPWDYSKHTAKPGMLPTLSNKL